MRLLPILLLTAACATTTPAPEEAPTLVQPNNATYGTDANLVPPRPTRSGAMPTIRAGLRSCGCRKAKARFRWR